MGEMAQRISKVDKEELLKILNCAFAEEWLAYYQYWVGAKVAEGLERPKVVKEFMEHAGEELKHADWLAERIIQLGGTPMNADTKVLVAQNLTAERCAVARYEQICEMCQGKDFETFRISRKILKEELEHEQEMEDFEADFKYYK